MNKVAILGGGLMGSGIATAFILCNFPVVLKEVKVKILAAGIYKARGGTRAILFIVHNCNIGQVTF